jgi:hypothetical protein
VHRGIFLRRAIEPATSRARTGDAWARHLWHTKKRPQAIAGAGDLDDRACARGVDATRGALDDAPRGADAVRELLERSLLRTRFFLALRLRFGRGDRGGVAGWIEFGYPRIHDVGSLYDAHAHCRVERLKAIDVPREDHPLGSMTGGRFRGATGDKPIANAADA